MPGPAWTPWSSNWMTPPIPAPSIFLLIIFTAARPSSPTSTGTLPATLSSSCTPRTPASHSASGTNAEEIKFQFSGGSTTLWARMLADSDVWNWPQIRMDAVFQFDILLLPKNQTIAHAVGPAPPLAEQSGCSGGSFTTAVNVTAP